MTKNLLLLPVLLLMAACTSNAPRGSESASVEVPVSRQTSGSDAQQRARVHTELGKLYLLDGRFDVALEEAGIAIEADAGYAPAYSLRGLTYMALRKGELAEDGFRRALSLAPNDPEINNDFGWFLCQSGRPKASIEHFNKAIANPLFSMPIKPLTNAGLCLLQIKDKGATEDQQAEGYFLRALRLDSKHSTALYWLADIAYRNGRFADAQTRLKDLHSLIDPFAASTWLALRVARRLGDRDEETRMHGLMRRKFRESPEYQKLSRGEFD